jgi:signal transduction histidine kinase/ActR/RegA family two-component response regulator
LPTVSDVPSASQQSRALAARLRRGSLGSGIFAIAVGSAVLVGWITGSADLKSLWFGPITMKANTALALVLAGSAVCLLQGAPPRAARAAAAVLATAVMLIGTLTLSEHVVGWDLGIDEALFVEAPGSPATTRPNRMGPPASLNFTLLGLALIGLARGERWLTHTRALALCAGVLALLPVIGYLQGTETLFGVARFTGIAFATALALCVLAAGIVLARPEDGFTRLLCRDDAAGTVARRLIVPAVAVPLLLALATRVGTRVGWYDTAFAASLVIVAFVVVFSLLIWRIASTVGRADEREREARLEAERANRLKDEFLATLSHELRTPLNSIVGWAHVLRSGRTDAETVERASEVISRNAAMQTQLIADILDVSRIVTGQLRVDRRTVDLATVLEAALDTLQPAAEAKQIRLERLVDPATGTVTGDGQRLQQVFWNLLSNAIKFTPAGGRVQVRLEPSASEAHIVVSDDGPGIAADFLPYVFDRFRQADSSSSRSHSGLGLGLAIVRHLVELHGGTVTAANASSGTGAVFTVRLPGRAAAEEVARLTAGTTAAPPSLAGIRVLVVDDSADARELVSELLRRGGAEVVLAASAADGLDALLRHRPDVVLADIEMPGEDGFSFIRQLRQHAAQTGGATPAIAITAYAASHDRVKTLMAGFDLHLSKPLPPLELTAAVARLARRAGEAALART